MCVCGLLPSAEENQQADSFLGSFYPSTPTPAHREVKLMDKIHPRRFGGCIVQVMELDC